MPVKTIEVECVCHREHENPGDCFVFLSEFAVENKSNIAAAIALPDSQLSFRCIICGAGRANIFLAACSDLYLSKPYQVDYVRCKTCALVQQHPTPINISDFYDSYPIHQTKSKLYSWFRRQLMKAVYVPPTQWPAGAALLDFGCGDGWYLEWCKEAGLDVVGFEYNSEHAAQLAQRIGVSIMSDPELLVEKYAEKFDVISLHFVVEHLTEPIKTFEMLRRLLKPGGIIRYVVPNISSWEFTMFKRRWHSLDAPRHISFMSSHQAKYIADRLGLRLSDEAAVAFPNGFGGSLPTALLGTFNAALFMLTLPVSIVVTRIFPGGNMAYVLTRIR